MFLVLIFVTQKTGKTELRGSRGETLKYNHTLYPTAAEMKELGRKKDFGKSRGEGGGVECCHDFVCVCALSCLAK